MEGGVGNSNTPSCFMLKKPEIQALCLCVDGERGGLGTCGSSVVFRVRSGVLILSSQHVRFIGR